MEQEQIGKLAVEKAGSNRVESEVNGRGRLEGGDRERHLMCWLCQSGWRRTVRLRRDKTARILIDILFDPTLI